MSAQKKAGSQTVSVFSKVPVGGVLLILVGVVLLLNTTDVIGWGVWWSLAVLFLPYLFVQIGIGILVSNKGLSNMLNIVVLVIFFAFGVARFYTMGDIGTLVDQVHSIEDSFLDATKSEINLSFEFGEFRVTDVDRAELLYSEVQVLDSAQITKDAEQRGETVVVNYGNQLQQSGFFSFPPMIEQTQVFTIELGALDLMSTLNLKSSFADSTYELDALQMEEISIQNSFGDITIDVGLDSLPSKIDIDNSFGSVSVNLPPGVGVNVQYDNSFGEVTVLDREFSGFGDGSYSSDGDSIIELIIDSSFGSVNISN